MRGRGAECRYVQDRRDLPKGTGHDHNYTSLYIHGAIRARRLSMRRGKTANVFGETRYAAKSWKGRKGRVLIKAEVVRLEGRDPKDIERFVVTNLKGCYRRRENQSFLAV